MINKQWSSVVNCVSKENGSSWELKEQGMEIRGRWLLLHSHWNN